MLEMISMNLGNSNQRGAFEARSELARVNYGEGLINHITREKDAFQTQTYEAGVVTEQESARENWDSPSEVFQSLDRIEDLTKSEAARKGITGEAVDLLVKENKSNAHAGVIQAMVDNRSYGDAREWYTENKDEILGETQSKIERLLDTAGKEFRSQELVDGMWDDYKDDPAAGRKFIRENAEPEDRDEALRRFNTRLNEDTEAQKQEWIEFQDQAYGTYTAAREGGMTPSEAYYSIPASIRENMKQTHRLALYEKMQADSRGSAVHTDPETFLDLYEMATGTPEEKRRFREEIDLRDYIGTLSVAHITAFAKLQDDEDEQAIASTWADLKKEVSTTAGFYDADTGKKEDATGIFQINERFDSELKALQDSTGKKASPADGREIADRLKIEIVREMPWYRRDQTLIAGTAEIEGVPTDLIDELAFRLTEAKRELAVPGEPVDTVTVQEVQDYYTYLKNKGIAPTPTPPKPEPRRIPWSTPFDNPAMGAPPGR
jgi:hypothetical protein